MSPSIPASAIALIKQFEGCHASSRSDDLLHAYPDPGSGADPWTIGWGTTIYPDGRAVAPGDAISRQQADEYLITTAQQHYWNPLSSSIPYWQEMQELMQSCLCSFAYNLGAGFYGAEGFNTISACLRDKRWDDVPSALLLYVNPGSSVEPGLRRRRQAEAKLWQQGLAALAGSASSPSEEPTQPIQTEEAPIGTDQLYEASSDTFLKKEKIDSSLLAAHLLVPIEAGRQYKVSQVLQQLNSSIQVRLAYGAGDWWVYAPHWQALPLVLPSSAAETAAPTTEAAVKEAPKDSNRHHLLEMPYFCQLDNPLNPYGSCNVTCVAMGLAYLGMPYSSGPRLQEDLYRKMEQLGWDRHDPIHLKALVESFAGYRDSFRTNGTFKDIQVSIDCGRPVIIHGYFTSSGHIIVIKGYDSTGFIVNDPYGEYFNSGYDTRRSGAGLHYSYGLIARTCSPESCSQPANLWIHSLFRL